MTSIAQARLNEANNIGKIISIIKSFSTGKQIPASFPFRSKEDAEKSRRNYFNNLFPDAHYSYREKEDIHCYEFTDKSIVVLSNCEYSWAAN